MKNNRLSLSATLVAITFCITSTWADDATWVPGGTEDWNVDANWLLEDGANFVPDPDFDSPVIANGGIAFLDLEAHQDPFPSVTISNGGLEIRAGGALSAETITVSDSSSLSLAGDGTLSVTGDAVTSGSTRIDGSGVNYSVGGNYTQAGSFHSVITGAQHSPVKVTGAANVSGTLIPEFSGVTPTLGNAWTLIDAGSVAGTFDTVDTAGLPPLEEGVIYTAAVDSGAGNIDLRVTNTLQLVVNRRTGASSIGNVVGDPIAVDSYTISSPSNLLNSGSWSSFADSGSVGGGWTEGAGGPGSLTESKAGGPGSIEVGPTKAVDIGTPYDPINFDPEDLQLSFSAEGVTLPGVVKYADVPFNLVLNVDPATGAATISNEATVPIKFDGYAVQSVSGTLQSTDGSWSSLADSSVGGAGWVEANPTANALAELNPTGTTTLAPTESLAIGTIFDTSGTADLSFQYFLAGGTPDLRTGFVGYGLNLPAGPVDPMCPVGDIDGDCAVGFPDFLILSSNFGMAAGASGGDLDGDGTVGFPDFLLLSANFGQSGGAVAVPEPTSLSLLGFAALVLGIRRRRK